MKIEIRKTKTGNCDCTMCGKRQEGLKMQPFTVWYKGDSEKRGCNNPVCSLECAEKFVEYLKSL